MLNKIKQFIFGEVVKGEPAYSKVEVTTVEPNTFVSFNDWAKQYNVSSRFERAK